MALYEKLEYELELITPAFIGGAFPKEQAELRPASFIGILRWWFRNLALTITDDIDAIYTLESELFGNTQRAGKVWFFLKPIEVYTYQLIDENYRFNDILYIGFGNFMRITYENLKRNRNKRYSHIYKYLRRENIPFQKETLNIKSYISKKVFKITFFTPKVYSIFIETLISLLDLSGTIGSRNRRGWGSIKVLKGLSKHFHEIYPLFAQSLVKELKEIKERDNISTSPKQGILVAVYPKKVFKKDYELFKVLGFAYKKYRQSLKHSQRKYLGSANPRRGSPFIFKIKPTYQGYFLTVTYIVNGFFLPQTAKNDKEFCEINIGLLKSLKENFGDFGLLLLKSGKSLFPKEKELDNLKEEC